jgi:hypothetical protein
VARARSGPVDPVFGSGKGLPMIDTLNREAG